MRQCLFKVENIDARFIERVFSETLGAEAIGRCSLWRLDSTAFTRKLHENW